ncbi:unnamed protein product [Clavelina lepadiformis]|uniref:Transmembrane protein 18 n=1 Tax=Clavelina lepadiformis TaxID=159417 RepID=A0ABP0GIR2_CLALP
MDDVSAVLHVIEGVDWSSEHRLLLILFLFYLFCVVCTILTWQRMNLQAAYFCFLCVAIYAAEHLNRWLAANWKLVSTKHQYFDSHGMFISIFYSIPVLFNLLVVVLKWMRTASTALIQVKQHQLRRQHREKCKKE